MLRLTFPAIAPGLRAAACAVGLSLLLSGCGFLPRPTHVPIPMQQERSSCGGPVRTLLVFLPGAGSFPQEFVREGFVDQVRRRRIAADMLLVDAHRGYYNERSIVERLDADVIAPARRQGYDAVWLVGISLGGLGALIHEERSPGQVAGLVVLAPYLGEESFLRGIAAAGGLTAWRAPAHEPPAGAFEVPLWRWLQGYAPGAGGAAAARPPLYLGYGTADRFAGANALLGAALPAAQVFTTDGGHDWPAWRNLWSRLLDVLPLPRCG